MKFKNILGVDFGGSGIKAAPISTKTGELLEDRYRIPTPQPATPDAVADVIKQLVDHFKWKGAVGVGFPSVVLNGVIKTASNIDKSWIGVDAQKIFSKKTGLPVYVVNDADAAGLAEMQFGAGRNKKGTVVLFTIGTGIGSALFTKGRLVANSEIGHVFLENGKVGEKHAADSVRQNEDLDWTQWGTRFNDYLREIEKLFWPELIIIGGGISKKPEKYMHAVDIKTPIVMAQQKNEAGIIGAALSVKRNKKELLEKFNK
jgi:predicted NBD/HSP70 family sugar kinase